MVDGKFIELMEFVLSNAQDMSSANRREVNDAYYEFQLRLSEAVVEVAAASPPGSGWEKHPTVEHAMQVIREGRESV